MASRCNNSSHTGSTSLLEPGSLLGRYELTELLGMGGMGVVYRAFDPQLVRHVAIKVARCRQEDSVLAQNLLLREAEALARVSHPNVISVYDSGTHHGSAFFVMEFVEGRPLNEWLRNRRPPLAQVLSAFVSAGRALAAAHVVGVIHGDFKPRNVLLSQAGRIVLIDFGLAPYSALGRASGTPGYMAPEQMAGQAPDFRSDQYCFCAALQKEMASRAAEEMSDFSPEAMEAIARGAHAKREQRFHSMEELLFILDREKSTKAQNHLDESEKSSECRIQEDTEDAVHLFDAHADRLWTTREY